MTDKTVLYGEIANSLSEVVAAYENSSGKKVGQISRSTSFQICIMIDRPDDIPWQVFSDEIIEPIREHFEELNWTVTTHSEPWVGFWIELS